MYNKSLRHTYLLIFSLLTFLTMVFLLNSLELGSVLDCVYSSAALFTLPLLFRSLLSITFRTPCFYTKLAERQLRGSTVSISVCAAGLV